MLQLRDAAGAAHHLAHLLQPLRVTTQAAARGQGLALLALQVGSRQLGGAATTLDQQRIAGIEAGGNMQQHQADQGKGGGINQLPARPTPRAIREGRDREDSELAAMGRDSERWRHQKRVQLTRTLIKKPLSGREGLDVSTGSIQA